MRILNLHGLGGTGDNHNYDVIRRIYPEAEIVSETNDYINNDPEDIINKYLYDGDFDIVVGNSFGGFFAYIIGEELKAKTVLTNPCIPASDYIKGLVSEYKYNDKLKELWDTYNGKNNNCYALLGTDDKVLNPWNTLRILKGNAHIELLPNAGHSLRGSVFEAWAKEKMLI